MQHYLETERNNKLFRVNANAAAVNKYNIYDTPSYDTIISCIGANKNYDKVKALILLQGSGRAAISITYYDDIKSKAYKTSKNVVEKVSRGYIRENYKRPFVIALSAIIMKYAMIIPHKIEKLKDVESIEWFE